MYYFECHIGFSLKYQKSQCCFKILRIISNECKIKRLKKVQSKRKFCQSIVRRKPIQYYVNDKEVK